MNNSELIDEARKLRNEYARKWRAANKDKVKKANERYWLKRAMGGQTDGKACDKR